MAALTANRIVPAHGGDWAQGPNVYADYKMAAVKIYKGAFVGLNATGYLDSYVANATGTTLVGTRYVGIAQEFKDNSSGAAGDKRMHVQVAGFFWHALASVAIADIGKPVFASDDNTLSIVSASNALLGWIVDYNSDDAKVLIRMPDLGENGAMFIRTGQITHTASHTIRLIHPTENHNGILILWAGELLTTGTGATSSVITLRDTAGTTTGVLFTSTVTAGDAVGDIIPGTANTMAIGAAIGSALVKIPADLGLDAFVTTAGTSGAGTIIVLGVAL